MSLEKPSPATILPSIAEVPSVKSGATVAKVMAFILIILAKTPAVQGYTWAGTLNLVAVILAWIAIIFCVVRGIPVVVESKKLFEKKENGKTIEEFLSIPVVEAVDSIEDDFKRKVFKINIKLTSIICFL